jgi:hypothetical protein
MQLIGENLWIVRKEFRVPGFGNLGGCATIMAYEPGKLMIVSPVRFEDAEFKEIGKLGEVRYLVSPNPVHHIYLPRAKRAFPKALVAGPPRSALKQEDLDFDVILTEETKFPWAAGVDTFRIQARAPLDEEYAFFHRESKTLVVTDFVFNIQNPGNWMNQMFLKLNGADRRLGMTRLGKLMFKPASVHANVDKMLALKPENLVMCHGEPVIGGAVSRLKKSFEL